MFVMSFMDFLYTCFGKTYQNKIIIQICPFLPEFFHYSTLESISSFSIAYLHYCKVIISLQPLTMKLRVKKILAGRMEGNENNG